MAAKLTPRQAIFVAEYVATYDGVAFNGTRAAIACGCPKASAHVTAARWLKVAKVKAAIDDAIARTAKKLEISVERTLREIAKVAYGDVGDLYDEDGNLLPVHRMSESARALVAGLEIENVDGPGRVRTVTHKVKIADKLRGLELLGKTQKLFTDRIEHDGRVTLEQLVCGKRDDSTSDAANR